MQGILREKLLAHALKLAAVSEVYRSESYRFVAAYFAWLEEAEKDLAGLRSPISVLLQAEKSRIASVLDGYLPPDVQAGNSIRKSQKAVAAQSLEKISKEFYSKIEDIDRAFEQLNEKLCHAVAVLASKEPALYGQLEASQRGVDFVWNMLGGTAQTVPMYNYFCAKLAATDRSYLLIGIIQKVLGNLPGRAERELHVSAGASDSGLP